MQILLTSDQIIHNQTIHIRPLDLELLQTTLPLLLRDGRLVLVGQSVAHRDR